MRLPAHEASWNLNRGRRRPRRARFRECRHPGVPRLCLCHLGAAVRELDRQGGAHARRARGPGTFSRLTEVDGQIAGFVHWCEPDPPVAIRLRFLFVAKPLWGHRSGTPTPSTSRLLPWVPGRLVSSPRAAKAGPGGSTSEVAGPRTRSWRPRSSASRSWSTADHVPEPRSPTRRNSHEHPDRPDVIHPAHHPALR